MNHWMRSGKTWESEPVWFFSGEWRASDMVGQWGRAEGERGTVTPDFCMRYKTCCMNYGSLHITSFPKSLSYLLKLESFCKRWESFWNFWKLLLETRVGWTTEPQAVPVAEPVFLRGTPRLPLSWDPQAAVFLREGFFHIEATPSLLGNCAHIPVISLWQRLNQLCGWSLLWVGCIKGHEAFWHEWKKKISLYGHICQLLQ